MYLNEFPTYTHLCCPKGNGMAMKRFRKEKKCVETLKIHWRANNVGVFVLRIQKNLAQNSSVTER